MASQLLTPSEQLRRAADSFVARIQSGQWPSVADYVAAHPDIAGEIRELFPKLAAEVRRDDTSQATGPFPSPSIHAGPVPMMIGEFHIVREVGRGGMGIVYEAVQESLGRQVALKVLPTGPASQPAYIERFRREAKAAARLHHSNIVPVFGVGESNGIHYYVMQFIDGRGLDSVIRQFRQSCGLNSVELPNLTHTIDLEAREVGDDIHTEHFEVGPLVPPDADAGRGPIEFAPGTPGYYRNVARLMVQVAEALAYAHHQGLLHRDIKPSNLLLDGEGTVWITDFGLAKVEGDDLTGTGDIVGTLRYMAPERFQGRSDARSDIYALGATLYELLTLRPLIDERDRLKVIEQLTRGSPVKPRAVARDIPRDLETIVLKAIAREPGQRYVTANEFADDLRRFLSDRPVRAKRSSAWAQFRYFCKRNPAVAGLSGLVFVLLVGLAGVMGKANYDLATERDIALTQKQNAESAQIAARDRLWESNNNLAQAGRYSRRMGQRYNSLRALGEARKIRFDPELRFQAIACLALPDLNRVREWDAWPDGTAAVDFDGDFQLYARGDRHGHVSVRWVADDSEFAAVPGGSGPAFPRFCPDGQFLAVWTQIDNRLRVWSVVDGGLHLLIEKQSSGAFDFRSDSRAIAAVRLDGSIAVHELPHGDRDLLPSVGPSPRLIALSPDGDRIATTGDEGSVLVRDVRSGRLIAELPQTAKVSDLSWHPHGRRLAVAGEDARIVVWDIPRQRPVQTMTNRRPGRTLIRYNHAGDLLAGCGEDGLLRLWDPRSGKALFQTECQLIPPRFSRDDRFLAAERRDNRLAIWEVASGREFRTLTRDPNGSQAPIAGATLHPRGGLIAAHDGDGVTLWDLSRGDDLTALPHRGCRFAAFLAAGDLLVGAADGLYRWPVTIEPNGSARIGPPLLLGSWPVEQFSADAAGTVVAVVTRGAAAFCVGPAGVVHLPHDGVRQVAVSPDGTKVISVSPNDQTARVWDPATGRPLGQYSAPGAKLAGFSPDGRYFAASAPRGWKVWEAASGSAGPNVPASGLSSFAFTPDGSGLLYETGSGVVRLLHLQTEEEIARFENPNQDRAAWLGLTPDGGQLITASIDSQSLHVWDLRAIRRELARQGLDWSAPQPPPAPRTALSLTVVGPAWVDPTPRAWTDLLIGTLARPTGDTLARRAAAFARFGLTDFAVADLNRALAEDPDRPDLRFQRGELFYQTQNWEPALDDFTAAMVRADLRDQARRMRGKVMLQLNRATELLREIDDELQQSPDAPQLLYQRALTLSSLDRYAEARDDLEAVLRRNPDHAMALNNLAWIFVAGPAELRQPERGLQLALRAIRLDPDRPTYLNTLGVAYARLRNDREAIAALTRGLEAGKGLSDAYNLYPLAVCYARTGDGERAWQCFRRGEQWQKTSRLSDHDHVELNRLRAEAREALPPPPEEAHGNGPRGISPTGAGT